MSSYNRPRTIGILELIKANAKTGIYTHQIATQLNVTPKQARESIGTLKRQGHIEGYGDTGAGRARAWVPKGAKLDMLATYTKPGTTAAMHLHRAANRAAAEAAGTTGARLTTPCNGPGYTPPKPLHTGNTGSATASTTASDGRTAAQRQWSAGQVLHASQISNEGAVWHRPTYDGAELRPYTGRPGANDHKRCGSMVGGKWQPYKPAGRVGA